MPYATLFFRRLSMPASAKACSSSLVPKLAPLILPDAPG
jgi:hypothetical protein